MNQQTFKKDNQRYDWLVKLLIIGDSGVGKTNILLRFCEDNFTASHLTTIGIDFKIKTITVDDKKIKMQIWDTAGQERFKTITQTYYKGAMGIILTYAVNDKQSFENIANWMKQINQHASENVVKLLIGNKCDCERTVQKTEGQALAAQYGIAFFETSALTNVNITEAFQSIAKTIKDNILVKEQPLGESVIGGPNTRVTLTSSKNQKGKATGCC